jgi:hypothetical protein
MSLQGEHLLPLPIAKYDSVFYDATSGRKRVGQKNTWNLAAVENSYFRAISCSAPGDGSGVCQECSDVYLRACCLLNHWNFNWLQTVGSLLYSTPVFRNGWRYVSQIQSRQWIITCDKKTVCSKLSKYIHLITEIKSKFLKISKILKVIILDWVMARKKAKDRN